MLKKIALLTALSASFLLAADSKTVRGTVYYRGGETASGAAVQLEDQTTLQVISRMTDRNGHYHFAGLNSNRDYSVRAMKKGYWSKDKTVSRFSSRPVETIDLYLRPRKR